MLGCGKTEDPAPARVAPPAASSAAAASAGVSAKPFTVAESGSASFLIDAPLEKIKGKATRLRGTLQIDPAHLSATRGEVDVDLNTLKTSTFNDPGKDEKQTEHTRNWLELGNDVDAKQRAENQWARFTIRSAKTEGSEKLSEIAESVGQRAVEVTVEGDLWLHGASVPKTVRLSVSFRGSPDLPTELQVKTLDPMAISLKAHDVKPRDIAGKFLQGALERVGEKIDDKVQISLDFTASPSSK